MKKIKKVLQQLLFDISLSISQNEKREYWIGNKTEYHFFLDLGPKILIIRDNKVYFLGSALCVNAKFSDKGELLYCRPMCMNTEKGDIVFYGKKKVYENYPKYPSGSSGGIIEEIG